MPTYEYACRKCGVVEAFQRMSEDALTACPECGKAGVKRIVSGGAGVIFKGDGFWETDYNRSSDYKEKAKKETEKVSKSDASSSSKKADKKEKKAKTS